MLRGKKKMSETDFDGLLSNQVLNGTMEIFHSIVRVKNLILVFKCFFCEWVTLLLTHAPLEKKPLSRQFNSFQPWSQKRYEKINSCADRRTNLPLNVVFPFLFSSIFKA